MFIAGWVAIALAVAVVATAVSLILFFSGGGPFGSLNDAGNAVIGILSAVLAVIVMNHAGGWLGAIASISGATLVAWGSWLVMSGTTGFVLAGFVCTIGFGLVGVWLALVAWAPPAESWFGPMLGLARVSSVAMIVGGLAAVPAAVMRIDSYGAMPGWLWLFAVGWIGVYLLYPIAVFGLGRRLLGT